MIDHKTIEQVLDRCDVVDVVSEYVQLRKSGSNYIGCCPFHKEKTGSFVVSKPKGIWHCFGCGRGGNVVDFIMKIENMTFPEAIKHLAKKANIKVIENVRVYTEEEKKEFDKRESLFVITKKAAEFYAAQLYNNDPDCKAAHDYVYRRWGENTTKEDDFPRMMQIGYAPTEDAFYQYAKKYFSTELMLEIGLIWEDSHHNIYDSFQHRVIIPIRDRFRNVIGFTCRSMDEVHFQPKYKNSKTSVIFKKSETVFGIDTAIRQAMQENVFYLVEGAPDVLKMQKIGVTNTVASLGTEWNREAFAKLKKYNATLCFIPDADLPKHGERFSPGTDAVLRNGKLAMQEGFRVVVKEIPTSNEKRDADSFFETKEMVYEIDNVDFVIWYARHMFDIDKDTTTERTDKMMDICELAALIEEDYIRDAIINQLGKDYGDKMRWKNILKKVIDGRQRNRALAISKKSGIDTLEKYGFAIRDNSYWGNNLNTQWSNFIMEPLFHIKDSYNAKRIYRIKNTFGSNELIELKTEELIALPKFQQRLENLGNYLFFGTMENLKKLKEYLYESTETAYEIKQLGWQAGGFFAWGNGIYYNNRFYPVDENGIVHLAMVDADGKETQENYYLPAMSQIYIKETELFIFERKFIFNKTHSAISLPAFCTMFYNVFGKNAKIGISYLLATLFKDIVFAKTGNFPILNLFGPKGSGKSQMAHFLMSFFIRKDKGINIRNATMAALSNAISQCSNALVHIDEYKNDLMPEKIEFLKGLYDGVGRTRMNMDQGKTQTTRVDSAVVLSGQEMPTIDIALFSRTIYLTFEKTSHSSDEKDKFDDLQGICEMGLQHLTNEILKTRNIVDASFREVYKTTQDELKQYNKTKTGDVEDRILQNWGMLLSIYRILKQPLQLPWDDSDMKDIIIECIERQANECTVGNEMGEFWNMVEFMISGGMIFDESDFKVKEVTKLKTNKAELEFKGKKRILMLRAKHIIIQYKIASRRTGDKTMSERSIKYYLETSPAYLGKKGTERFKVYIDGVLQQKNVGSPTLPIYKPVEQYDNPMCFDYDMLVETYGLNLIKAINIEDEEHKEEEVKVKVKEEHKEPEQQDLPF